MTAIVATIFLFLMFTAASLLGFYSLALNPKEKGNRKFFMVSLFFMILLSFIMFIPMNESIASIFLFAKWSGLYLIDIFFKILIFIMIVGLVIMKKIGSISLFTVPEGFILTQGYVQSNIKRISYVAYIVVFLVVGSFINLLHLYFKPEDYVKTLLLSMVIVFTASFILLITILNIKPRIYGLMLSGAFALLTYVTIARFTNSVGSNTIWLFVVIFLLMAILSETGVIFFAIAFAGTFPFINTIYRSHHVEFVFGYIQALLIVTIYIFAISLIISINRIFFSHIKNNVEQIKIQEILHRLSLGSAITNKNNIKEICGNLLNDLVEHYDFKCAEYISLENAKINCDVYVKNQRYMDEDICLSSEFYDDKVIDNMDVLEGFKTNFEEGKIVLFINKSNRIKVLNIKELSGTTDVIPTEMEKNIDYILIFPVVVDGKVMGVIRFCHHNPKSIRFIYNSINSRKDLKNIDNLKLIINTLANAVGRCEAIEEMNRLSFVDHSTGLLNRAALKYNFDNMISSDVNPLSIYGIGFLKLADFNDINISIGYEQGDKFIKSVGDIIDSYIGKDGFLAKYGAGEFLITKTNSSSKEEFVQWFVDIIEEFDKGFSFDEQEYRIKIYSGVAFWGDDGLDADEIIKNAELAMHYALKHDEVCKVCDETIKAENEEQKGIINDLSGAIDKNELFLEFLPQIDYDTENIICYEAVIKWKRNEKEIMAYQEFSPYAKKGGLIKDIDRWALKKACLYRKKIPFTYNFTVAVNISRYEFYSEDFVFNIISILNELGLEGRFLEIEIEEDTIVAYPEISLPIIEELSMMGITVTVDNFGTTRTSLTMFDELAIHKIKVDKIFSDDIEPGSRNRVIFEATLMLANTMGANVVAMGIDTAEKAENIRLIGARYFQGDHIEA